MITTACFLFVCALLPSDNGPRSDSPKEQIGLTREAERLLRIAEDPGQSSEERTRAIDQLGRRGESAAVPRLLRLLPGKGDVITYRVVIALGQIGDSSALPALRKLRDDPNVELRGKIRSALDGAIDALAKTQGK
jgi:HEAT repeat protein